MSHHGYTEKIPVIYYHSVGKFQPGWMKNYLTIELPFFWDQFTYIVKHYNSISLNEYLELRKIKYNNIKNPLVITFDDGYLDNWVWAFPLLKKYGFKATIFVNPDFVDKKNGVRPNLEDVWEGKADYEDLNQSGFLSWDEMRCMEESGLVSIESHTMTHTKYFISDKIVGFHRPGSDCLYPVGNLYPDRKPYYIGDPEFEKLIPYGYPYFEQASSVIARKATINQLFLDNIVDVLKNNDWSADYNFKELHEKVNFLYSEYKKNNDIIQHLETEKEYKDRVRYELEESKAIIERELNKKVEFLCWPHGDNNEIAHNIALELGYKATTLGKMPDDYLDNTRIKRFGLGKVKNSRFLSSLKMKYKMNSFIQKEPYHTIKKVYEIFRDYA